MPGRSTLRGLSFLSVLGRGALAGTAGDAGCVVGAAAGGVGACKAPRRGTAGLALLQVGHVAGQALPSVSEPSVSEQALPRHTGCDQWKDQAEAYKQELDQVKASCCPCAGAGGNSTSNEGCAVPMTRSNCTRGDVSPDYLVNGFGRYTEPGQPLDVVNDGLSPALCAVFGDPHFNTFDGARNIIQKDFPFWIVKSRDIWIQGLSKKAFGDFMAIAVGGPFMKGNILVLYNGGLLDADHDGHLHVLWNGEPIMTELDAQGNAEFEKPFLVWAARRPDWDPTLHDQAILEIDPIIRWAVCSWPDRFSNKPDGGIMMFRFPNDIELTVTGADLLSAIVKMAPVPTGQGGYCGNFDGTASNDFVPPKKGTVPAFLAPVWNTPIGDGLEAVPNTVNLFLLHQSPAAVALHDAAQASGQDSRSPRDSVRAQSALPEGPQGCSDPSTMKAAQDACKGIVDDFGFRACVSDVCTTGNKEAAKGIAAAEALEARTAAQGIAVLVGNGRCVDEKGQPFMAIASAHVRGNEGCRRLLEKTAAHVKGVLGAQMKRGGDCEVLVDSEEVRNDLLAENSKQEGWAASTDTSATNKQFGHRLVAGASPLEENYICWRIN